MIDLRTPTPEQHRRRVIYYLDLEKQNARICLHEYRRSRKACFLWQAISCTQAALRLGYVLSSARVANAQG